MHQSNSLLAAARLMLAIVASASVLIVAPASAQQVPPIKIGFGMAALSAVGALAPHSRMRHPRA
jgi:hypothetical protein